MSSCKGDTDLGCVIAEPSKAGYWFGGQQTSFVLSYEDASS